jgi:hypothetical protein
MAPGGFIAYFDSKLNPSFSGTINQLMTAAAFFCLLSLLHHVPGILETGWVKFFVVIFGDHHPLI